MVKRIISRKKFLSAAIAGMAGIKLMSRTPVLSNTGGLLPGNVMLGRQV